jgi:predicted RNA-binding protein with PUA-like domain
MAYWLLKTEPSTWSWNDQVKKRGAGELWSGVRNHQAKLNLMKMKKGERGFFYHSGDAKQIVGIVEIAREHYPDPTDKTGKFVVVDVAAVEPLPKPVTLAAVKADTRLKNMVLVNNSRLSVQPVRAQEWKTICAMGGMKGT